MADPKEIQRDDNLMVIFLMSMYEMFTSSTRDGSYLAHMHGTQAIIAHRDGATLQDGNNHLTLLLWYLTDLKPPPIHLAGWVQQIPFDSEMKKQLTGLLSTTAVVCAKLNERYTLGTAPDLGSSDLQILEGALHSDNQLQQWTASLPPTWICVERDTLSHSNRPDWAKKLLTIPGAPDHVHTYSNPVAANTKFSLSMLSRKYRCLGTQLKERGFNLLVSLTDEIAETIPYSIKLSPDGSADPKSPQDIPGIYAYCILWSTYTSLLSYQSATMKERAYTHRVMWFGAMLRFLRDTTGIAKVEVFLKEQSQVP
ncbi:hypothetical protein N7493_008045 [Penicillium malachiteum]|uniref:Uncharacterized protein n=1 Tax=Penicillium malachiteum TaxID=1324776 RepID=A0AAD6HGI3_9EURO|nr:hypothetical protein N7493_008045 [Penicillium malachiteum]